MKTMDTIMNFLYQRSAEMITFKLDQIIEAVGDRAAVLDRFELENYIQEWIRSEINIQSGRTARALVNFELNSENILIVYWV